MHVHVHVQVNAHGAPTLTNCQKFRRANEHALSMPRLLPHHDISKSLRCYKRETLCKPLFSKTVLQYPRGFGEARRYCVCELSRTNFAGRHWKIAAAQLNAICNYISKLPAICMNGPPAGVSRRRRSRRSIAKSIAPKARIHRAQSPLHVYNAKHRLHREPCLSA